MKLIIGTRDSRLARWQANEVANQLQQIGVEATFCFVQTLGDAVQDKALTMIGSTGVFTKALDEALLSGKIDIAVHSAKDMPGRLENGIQVLAALKRADAHDVVLSCSPEAHLENMTRRLVVGTGSVRRQAFMQHYYPFHETRLIRGNIDTRIQRLQAGEYDLILLAKAGVIRSNYQQLISQQLPLHTFVPAAGQGTIAVTGRKENDVVNQLVAKISHIETEITLTAERAFLQEVEGGCQLPVFAYATTMVDKLIIWGGIAATDGTTIVQRSLEGTTSNPTAMGQLLAQQILSEYSIKSNH